MAAFLDGSAKSAANIKSKPRTRSGSRPTRVFMTGSPFGVLGAPLPRFLVQVRSTTGSKNYQSRETFQAVISRPESISIDFNGHAFFPLRNAIGCYMTRLEQSASSVFQIKMPVRFIVQISYHWASEK
jgi:hypothetical protein